MVETIESESQISGSFSLAQLVQTKLNLLSTTPIDLSMGPPSPAVDPSGSPTSTAVFHHGGCLPQIVLDKAGAVNVFKDQGKDDGRVWDRVEWDVIVDTDPDLIVLIELSTESAGKNFLIVTSTFQFCFRIYSLVLTVAISFSVIVV